MSEQPNSELEDKIDVRGQLEAATVDDVFGELTENGPNYRNVGFFGTVVLMMKTQIGLGVLAIPSALEVLGMVPGVICLVLIGAMTTWSGWMIGRFKLNHREMYSIDDAGAIIWGTPGRVICAVAFCLYYIFNSASAILGIEIGLNSVSSHATCTAVFSAIAAIAGFAFSSVRTLGRITWLAWVGLPCIMSAIIIVTIAVGIEDRPASAPKTSEPWTPDWVAVANPGFAKGIAAVANLLFAFSGGPAFFAIASEMRDPKHFGPAVVICQTGITIIYTIIGCVIYYYCGTYVSSPALGSAGGLIKIVSYAFALPGLLVTMTIVTHIPAKYCFVHILRGSRHLASNSATHWITWLSCTFGTTVIAYIIASSIPSFDDMVSLIGAFVSPTICLIPYAGMWLSDNWHKGQGQRKTPFWIFMVGFCVFVIVIGLFITVAGTYGSVMNIKASYAASGGSAAFSCADNSNSS
ncbi:hypothetical protein N7478_001709 [Penicillium angulare]|uniref:uncharacterized protein n=1 Tax=Penicillium angulare TaxID=116970 RepID=UPI00254260D5|nr:uncharacterized protein N7478_001709 [Penicillium angulare]KAJ5288679.1 hypothetical protein N7478_001709 [Penicillium angulare]